MVDSSKKFDEEYHFSEDESTEEFAAMEEDSFKKPESKLRNFIVLFLGLFLVVFVVYKILGFLFAPKQVVEPIKHTPVITEEVVVPQQIVKPMAPVEMPPQNTAAIEQFTQKLSSLEISAENNKNDINKMTSNMAEIQQAVAKMDEKLSNLSYNIQKVTDELATQQNQMVELKLLVTPKPPVKVAKKVVAKRQYYYIQAVIPGRAWLKTRSGQTITVSKGSHIPGYGRVIAINPHTEEVIVNTGEVLTYSPEDR